MPPLTNKPPVNEEKKQELDLGVLCFDLSRFGMGRRGVGKGCETPKPEPTPEQRQVEAQKSLEEIGKGRSPLSHMIRGFLKLGMQGSSADREKQNKPGEK